MKNIKKITAVFLALTTLFFSFSLNGFATQETEAEASDIRLFKGKLVFCYPDLNMLDNPRFVITQADEENEKICLEVDTWDCICTDEKTVIGIDNNMFDPFATYCLYIYNNNEEIFMEEFIPVDIGATSLEFVYDSYHFEEKDQLDLTEEILVPVNYNGNIRLSAGDTYCYNEYGARVVDIDGFTVTALNHGNGYFYLYDGNNKEADKAWFQVKEETADSFKEAFEMSSSVFFERSLESAENFLLLGTSIGGFLLLPFLVLFEVVKLPFEMLF